MKYLAQSYASATAKLVATLPVVAVVVYVVVRLAEVVERLG